MHEPNEESMSEAYDPQRRIEALRVAMHALDTSQRSLDAMSSCEVLPGITRVAQPIEIAVRSQHSAIMAILDALSDARVPERCEAAQRLFSGNPLLPGVSEWLKTKR
jgi:hypothetical protein